MIENIVQNMIVYWWTSVFLLLNKGKFPSGE